MNLLMSEFAYYRLVYSRELAIYKLVMQLCLIPEAFSAKFKTYFPQKQNLLNYVWFHKLILYKVVKRSWNYVFEAVSYVLGAYSAYRLK